MYILKHNHKNNLANSHWFNNLKMLNKPTKSIKLDKQCQLQEQTSI